MKKISKDGLLYRIKYMTPRGRDGSICGRFRYGNYNIQIGIIGGDGKARFKRWYERNKK